MADVATDPRWTRGEGRATLILAEVPKGHGVVEMAWLEAWQHRPGQQRAHWEACAAGFVRFRGDADTLEDAMRAAEKELTFLMRWMPRSEEAP